VTKSSIGTQNKRAKRLWRIYSSLEEALRDLYPEYPWDPLQFVSTSHRVQKRDGSRRKKNILLQLIIKAEQHLRIQQVTSKYPSVQTGYLNLTIFTPPPQPSDWYSITLADLDNIGAPSKLRKVELAEALQERYPDFKWEKAFLLKGRYGQQRRLENMVAALFPVLSISLDPFSPRR